MKSLVFPSKLPITLPIVGSATQLFPVARVYCVGQNYAAHAKEMGTVDPHHEPFFFTKPSDAVILSPARIPFPPMCAELHHEVELVVAIGNGGKNICVADARRHVFGFAVGLDLTRRDLQRAAKAKGRPWDLAKGFDMSAPCSPIVPAAPGADLPRSGAISLTVNGQLKQSGDLGDMLLEIGGLIATLSRFVELQPGDLIFTGTPEGVGPLAPGDVVEGRVAGVGTVRLEVDPVPSKL